MRELPQLPPRGGLYLATGTSYRQALKDYFNQEGNAEVWVLDYGYRAGDLILTAIPTVPRMFIALEVAAADGAAGTDIAVDWDRSVEFRNGILADAVAQRAGIDTFDFQAYYTGSQARRLHKALDEVFASSRAGRRGHLRVVRYSLACARSTHRPQPYALHLGDSG